MSGAQESRLLFFSYALKARGHFGGRVILCEGSGDERRAEVYGSEEQGCHKRTRCSWSGGNSGGEGEPPPFLLSQTPVWRGLGEEGRKEEEFPEQFPASDGRAERKRHSLVLYWTGKTGSRLDHGESLWGKGEVGGLLVWQLECAGEPPH